MDKINPAEKGKKINTGISCIDDLMDGGLEPGVITEIYGEGGAGKSNLSMQFTVSALKNDEKVIFLDTEGLSTERLLQISSSDESLLKRLLLYRVSSLDDQELSIIKSDRLMEKEKNVSLLVIDSFTEYFRLEKTADASGRVRGMQQQISLLSGIALKYSIPILITNQIYMDVDSGNLQPFGGYVIDHSMKAIYGIRKIDSGFRRMSVTKHRSIEEGRSTTFKIVSYGISCEAQNEQNIKEDFHK